MESLTDVERWLNKLTKRELLHLIVWVLQPPDEYNTLLDSDKLKEWMLNSAKHVTAYQNELLELDRKQGRGSRSTVCHTCDEITRKLTET